MKIFTFISALLFSFYSLAAYTGEITILSYSGEPFYATINGAYHNYHPRSTVNLELPGSKSYRIQLFSAGNNFSFDRNIVVKPNRRVTYRIERKYGQYLLKFHSNTPLYDNPYDTGEDINIHPPHPPHDIYPHPPVCNGSGSYGNGGNPYYGGANILSNADFDNLKRAIERESFSDDQLRIARRAARDTRMSVRQIKDIARLFTFSSERLAFTKAAYANCLNRHNYYEVLEVLNYTSDKEELEAFMDAH